MFTLVRLKAKTAHVKPLSSPPSQTKFMPYLPYRCKRSGKQMWKGQFFLSRLSCQSTGLGHALSVLLDDEITAFGRFWVVWAEEPSVALFTVAYTLLIWCPVTRYTLLRYSLKVTSSYLCEFWTQVSKVVKFGKCSLPVINQCLRWFGRLGGSDSQGRENSCCRCYKGHFIGLYSR